MQRYREFSPTGFDPAGAFLDEQQDWFVVPVARNRDSNHLAESNFEAALGILGGENPGEVEVHRFGHWGPGWFEIIIINPELDQLVKLAEGIETALEQYPLLDDEDYYQREWDLVQESWENTSLAERIKICAESKESIFAARRDQCPSGVEAWRLGVE